MIYPIVKYGDPVLEKPAAAITEFDDELRKLADDMFESMYAAHGSGWPLRRSASANASLSST